MERRMGMKLQQICWNLFQQSGQIGYYLLGCQIEEHKEDSTGGSISACERSDSAQQRL